MAPKCSWSITSHLKTCTCHFSNMVFPLVPLDSICRWFHACFQVDQNLHIIHTPQIASNNLAWSEKTDTSSHPTHSSRTRTISLNGPFQSKKLCESAWNGPLGSVELEHNHLNLEESLFLTKKTKEYCYEEHELQLLRNNSFRDVLTQTN